MSYCRWSSDDYKSDIYAWEDCGGGYYASVATHRYVTDEEFPPPASGAGEWVARWTVVNEIIRRAKSEPIGLPSDGETYHVQTINELLELFLNLRDAGYYVPDYAIEAAREECNS